MKLRIFVLLLCGAMLAAVLWYLPHNAPQQTLLTTPHTSIDNSVNTAANQSDIAQLTETSSSLVSTNTTAITLEEEQALAMTEPENMYSITSALANIDNIIHATPFALNEEEAIVGIARQYFAGRTIDDSNPYYYETNAAFLLAQAENGDNDAINALLFRLDPNAQQMVKTYSAGNLDEPYLTQMALTEQPYFEAFYQENNEVLVDKFNAVVLLAAAYGNTSSLHRLIDPTKENQRLQQLLEVQNAAIRDGDAYAEKLSQYMQTSYPVSAEQYQLIEQAGDALYQKILQERSRLHIDKQRIITLENARDWQNHAKQ